MFNINKNKLIKNSLFKKVTGVQPKFQKDGFWYKEDSVGGEGSAEYISSLILMASSLEPMEYVVYEQGYINNIPGCRSKNFLNENEEFITLYQAYKHFTKKDLSDDLMKYGYGISTDIKNYLIDWFKENYKIDLTDYLSKIYSIDFITLNPDRHLNNLGIIKNNKDNTYRAAPIFDNGLGFNIQNVPIEKIRTCSITPYPKINFDLFGPGFNLDYEYLEKLLEEVPSDNKEKQFLLERLPLIKKYIPAFMKEISQEYSLN